MKSNSRSATTRRSPPRGIAPPKRFRLQFFGEVIAELRKAVWPTRREVVRLTAMVLAISIAVGLFLGAVDFSFTQLAKLVFPFR